MKDLNRFLSRSLRWIGFEAISYQLVLLLHQLALFKVVDYTLYGVVGTLFSLVYLAVSIADFGLESSISPFFAQLLLNGSRFRRFFILQLLPNLFFAGILAAGFFFIGRLSFLSSISVQMFLILVGLVVTETVKKTLRTAIHLAFLNSEAAFIEIGSIFLYVGSVWTFYFLGFPITLLLVFVPMFLVSLFSAVCMFFVLFLFSLRLPKKSCVTSYTDTNYTM